MYVSFDGAVFYKSHGLMAPNPLAVFSVAYTRGGENVQEAISPHSPVGIGCAHHHSI